MSGAMQTKSPPLQHTSCIGTSCKGANVLAPAPCRGHLMTQAKPALVRAFPTRNSRAQEPSPPGP